MPSSVWAWLGVAVMTLTLPGCGSLGCPGSVDQARNTEFSLGDNTVVAVGRVARFVPSPVGEARGYDLDVLETYVGTAHGTMFLRTEAELPAIEQGAAVLIVARRVGPGPVLRGDRCPPLVTIPAGELPGGA